jgi:hypothetical protein
MRVQTSEAARQLGMHPAHLLLHVAELDRSLTFSAVWPEIDEAWVKTVSACGHHIHRDVAERAPGTRESASRSRARRLSAYAVRVLDKLHRQAKYGNVSVASEALINLARVSKRELKHALGELRTLGLLDRDGTGRGKISLNSAKRSDIEAIIRAEP